MQRSVYVQVLLWLVASHLCFAQQPADSAANTKTRQVLTYIAGLPRQGKVLSGQFAGYSPDTFGTQIINEITSATGQVPAIVGCDYACGWNYRTPPQTIIDYSCNPTLKSHWNNGGLVTINMHLPNPVSANGGGYKDRMGLNFGDLIKPSTDAGARWRLFLDRIAEGLDDLQRAGVTVLFRPLHEMNGDWFYWCNQDAETFKNVWRDMFLYLTATKGLHNLIWVYSPDQSRANPSQYYPGDCYVDIVGLDVYTDDPVSMQGYAEMIGLNKTFALTEVGPQNTNGQFDYTRWITAIQSSFPAVAYFVAWNDGWAPSRNQNAYAFLNNGRIVNRAQVNVVGGTGTTTSAPASSSTAATSTSTSGSTSNTVLYNFSQGIGQWKGSNIAAGVWQSNEFSVQSTDSLKADVQLTAGGSYVLYTQQQSTFLLAGRTKLVAHARVASWGFASNGKMTAKLYVKTGSAWQWYDSGAVELNSSSATALTLNLGQISAAQLSDVREIGVEYGSTASGSQSSIYLAYIYVQ